MATAEALVTLEEFAAMRETGHPSELVRGRIVELPPPKPRHGTNCFRFARLMGNHVYEHGLGELMTNDTGVITTRDPDTVRGADIAYYSLAKLPPVDLWDDYFALPPDLVVEVRSPSDRWGDLMRKVVEYLQVGVSIVVVLDAVTRSAHIFEADKAPRMLGPDETMTFPDLLGDFRVVVGQIFK